MISRLRGTAVARNGERIVFDVGGVGYALAVTPTALRLAESGGEVSLDTYLHVREDTLQLYGFASTAERSLFELLLGVSGVGPKAALAIVSGFAPDQIRRAVATSDHALFTSIPGIGRRTAERVVVDLKDKVGAMEIAAVPADGAGGDDHAAARDALVGLGMSVAEAEAALRQVDEDAPIEERVRLALSSSLTGAA